MDNIVSAKALAQLLRLTERRVQMLAKEGVFLKEGVGKYLMQENVHRYLDYISTKVRQDGEDTDDLNISYKKEKLRLTAAQADNEQIKLGTARFTDNPS